MSTDVDTIKQELLAFFKRNVPHYDVTEDEDIFAAGYVSSLFVMQLVVFCEKAFDLTFLSTDLDNDNFSKINTTTPTAQLIARRKRAAALSS